MAFIYKIEHIATARCYVGHTSDAIYKRWKTHKWRLNNNRHHSPHLQNAWNKYGHKAFAFLVIEECLEQDKLVREQFYIDNLDSCFNVVPIAAAGPLGRKDSAKTIERKKLAAANNPVCQSGHIPIQRIGMKDTPETIAKRTASVKAYQEANPTIKITNGESEANHPINQPIPEGWHRGRINKISEIGRARTGEIRSEESKAKMSSSASSAWSDPVKRQKMLDARRPFQWMTNGKEDRKLFEGESLPEGFYLGREAVKKRPTGIKNKSRLERWREERNLRNQVEIDSNSNSKELDLESIL